MAGRPPSSLPVVWVSSGWFFGCCSTIILSGIRAFGEAERAYITSDPPDPPVQVPWLRLLAHRQTWAFCTGMFMTAPVFWFYLYWTPGFLHERYGLDMEHLGLPLVVISLMTCLGSIGGG